MKTSTILFLAFAICVLIAAFIAREYFPPAMAVRSPELATLRKKQGDLAQFTDEQARKTDATLKAVQKTFWTDATLDYWRTQNVPAGWHVQPLGNSPGRTLRALRCAFQRPNAGADNYDEMLSLLRALEGTQACAVNSLNLVTRPGYEGSRQFSSMVIISSFFLPLAAEGESQTTTTR